MAAPKKNAVLFTGPPMSKAIMAPRISASTILFPVLIDTRPRLAFCISNAIGTPRTFIIRTPMKAPDTMGITRIGMMGRRYFETGTFLRPCTT